MQALSTAESETQVEVKTESGTVPLDVVEAAIECAAAATWKQDTLSDELFPATKRRDVPTVKVTFSGSVEMSVTRFQELIDGNLKTGAVVECSLTGHFARLATGWKKRSVDGIAWWEQEGQPSIAIDDVNGLHLTGGKWFG